MPDAQHDLFFELAASVYATDNQFQRVRRLVPFLDSVCSCLDDRCNELDDALCERKACRSYRKIDKKFGAAFMFDVVNFASSWLR